MGYSCGQGDGHAGGGEGDRPARGLPGAAGERAVQEPKVSRWGWGGTGGPGARAAPGRKLGAGPQRKEPRPGPPSANFSRARGEARCGHVGRGGAGADRADPAPAP